MCGGGGEEWDWGGRPRSMCFTFLSQLGDSVGLETQRGVFPRLHSSFVRMCLSEKEFGNVFLKQTRGRKEEKGSAGTLRGSGLWVPCLNCPEIPPVHAVLIALEPGAFGHDSSEGFTGLTPHE